MAATIELPAVGPVKREVVVVGAAGVGLVGIIWWRRARESAAAEPLAEEPTAEAGDYAAGVDAYANPAGGSTVVGGSAVTEIDPDDMPPTSNPQWATRAVGKLSDVGWDPMLTTKALAKYLTRTHLGSSAEVEIVRAAVAMVGPPPVGEFSILMPVTPAKPSGSTTTPKPKPAATEAKPKPKAGVSVTVQAWRAQNTPWQSSVGGIAKHYGKTAGHVWGLPQNKALRARRGSMTRIRPGDKVYVDPK